MVCVQRCDQGGLHHVGDHRRRDERRLDVLLLAHRGRDVHDAWCRARHGSGGTENCRRRARDFGDSDRLSRGPADARPRLGGDVDLDDLLTRARGPTPAHLPPLALIARGAGFQRLSAQSTLLCRDHA